MSLPFEIEMRRDEIRAEVEKNGAELVDLTFRHASGRSVITLIVDKDGGISLDECADINRRVGAWLDELSARYEEGTNFLKGSYYLEVNSPGLDRPLRSERDFLKTVGQELRIVYRDDAGVSRDYDGEVLEVKDGIVRFERPKDAKALTVRIENIQKAVRQIKFGK